MDNLNNLLEGFGHVLKPINLLYALIGVTVGTAVGALPGIGPAMTVALLLPITYGMEPPQAPMGVPQLADGIDVVVAADGIDVVVPAVGIFAVGEALWIAAHLRRKSGAVIPVGRPWMGKEDWRRSWLPWLRGTALAFPFGALPPGGAEIPTFLSYTTEKRLSKHPEEFGHGAIEGVAGPEAANNASAAGTLVPMLALGLPTNATAAVCWPPSTRPGERRVRERDCGGGRGSDRVLAADDGGGRAPARPVGRLRGPAGRPGLLRRIRADGPPEAVLVEHGGALAELGSGCRESPRRNRFSCLPTCWPATRPRRRPASSPSPAALSSPG